MSDDDARDEVAAFLAIVERDRAARCDTILNEAQNRAAELTRSARRDAHGRVSTAVRDDRARSHQRVEAARAELATRERQLEREVKTTLLVRGWERLRVELADAWTLAERRARWIDALIADAGRLLPRGSWRIEHPRGLAELESLSRAAEQASGAVPALEPADIEAGLRIHVQGATLDGSLDGLLADRRSVEGRLLRELGRREGA